MTINGTGETMQLIKSLPYKHKSMILKKCDCNINAGEPETGRPLGLGSQQETLF